MERNELGNINSVIKDLKKGKGIIPEHVLTV